MRLREWLKLLNEFRSRGVNILHISSLEAATNMKRKSLAVALTRLENIGVIRRVSREWICIPPCSLTDIVKIVYPSSYISLEWALHYHEVIDQKIHTVTLVWLGKPKTVRMKHYIFELHKIKRELHFGYDENLIAEPEKALLDTLYIRRREPDQLNLENLNPKKLARYAEKYPKTIQKHIRSKYLSRLGVFKV